MVPSRHEEVLSGCVSVHDFVLGSVEDGVVDGQHGADRQDLLRALIPEGQTTIYYRSGIDTFISYCTNSVRAECWVMHQG